MFAMLHRGSNWTLLSAVSGDSVKHIIAIGQPPFEVCLADKKTVFAGMPLDARERGIASHGSGAILMHERFDFGIRYITKFQA